MCRAHRLVLEEVLSTLEVIVLVWTVIFLIIAGLLLINLNSCTIFIYPTVSEPITLHQVVSLTELDVATSPVLQTSLVILTRRPCSLDPLPHEGRVVEVLLIEWQTLLLLSTDHELGFFTLLPLSLQLLL